MASCRKINIISSCVSTSRFPVGSYARIIFGLNSTLNNSEKKQKKQAAFATCFDYMFLI